MHYITTQPHSTLGAMPDLSGIQKTLTDALKGLAQMYATQYTPYQVYNIFRFGQPLGTSEADKAIIAQKQKNNEYTAQWKPIRNVLSSIYTTTTGGKTEGFYDFSYNTFKTAYLAACAASGITPFMPTAGPSSLPTGEEEKPFPWVPVIAGVGALGLVAVLLATRKS